MPETTAMEELVRDASSRKRFLKMVGGAGATGAFAMVLAACGSDSKSTSTGAGATAASGTTPASNKGDLAILNYALTLEYLEADFYQKVIDSGEIKDKKIAALAMKIGENEKEHVDALKATIQKLGGKPAAVPTTKFDAVIAGGPKKILATAASVENLGASAYLGQAPRITNPEVLAAALSIHSVEARHAAALNTLVADPVTPDGAFAKPAQMAQVLQAVKPFIA